MSATITVSPTVTEELPCTTISSRRQSEGATVRSSADHVYGRLTHTIIFDDCPTGLGIKIIGGAAEEEGEKNCGIYIKKVLFGGLASVDGRLQEGDEILEVNGDSLSGLSNQQAVQLLRQAAASNYFKFIITRDEKARCEFEDCLETHGAVSCGTSSVADELCSQTSHQSPGGKADSPTPQSETSRSNTPQQHPHIKLRFPGELEDEELGEPERYSPPSLHDPGFSSPTFSPPLDACLSPPQPSTPAYNRSALPPTPLPAYGAPLPKISNERAAATPLHRGPLRPVSASTPQATVGFLASKSSTPQTAPTPHHPSPGGASSVFEPSPVSRGSEATPLHLGDNRGHEEEEEELFFAEEDKLSVMSEEGKLSLDPNVQLRVEKLETALRYLGLDPTQEQQEQLRHRVHVDANGSVTYGDFVRVARDIFKHQLEERPLTASGHTLMMHKLDSLMSPRKSCTAGGDRSQNISAILSERDAMRSEIIRLQNALREKETACGFAEEELLRVRKETQQTIIENRSLHSKVHLVEQAQRASRSMEQDYEEVVRLLEAEVGELKAREHKIMDHPQVQKRIAILASQLRKAEFSRKTYEVSTEKLLQFVESLHEVLTGQGDGFCFKDQLLPPPPRPGDGGRARPPGYLGKTKKHSPLTLAAEAREVVKTVQSLIEVEPLPFGWDEAYTEEGIKYYINHVTAVTSWVHPLSNVEHTSSSRPVSTHGRSPPPMPASKHTSFTEPRT